VVDVPRIDDEPLAWRLLQVIQLEESDAFEIDEADIELWRQALADGVAKVVDPPEGVALAEAAEYLPTDAVGVASEVLGVSGRILHAAGNLAILIDRETIAVPPRSRRR
jgi:hypothetical protein